MSGGASSRGGVGTSVGQHRVLAQVRRERQELERRWLVHLPQLSKRVRFLRRPAPVATVGVGETQVYQFDVRSTGQSMAGGEGVGVGSG